MFGQYEVKKGRYINISNTVKVRIIIYIYLRIRVVERIVVRKSFNNILFYGYTQKAKINIQINLKKNNTDTQIIIYMCIYKAEKRSYFFSNNKNENLKER